MNKNLSRRNFLKVAAITAGGAVSVGLGLPLLAGEKEAIFDPNDSYWAQEQPPANPPLRKDITADVAIIGGGYTGLAAAWHLKQFGPDLDIVVLEAQQVGHGASGRNGGMVLSQTGVESLEIAYDDETHKWTYDLTVKSMRELQSLVEATGIDCELRLDGYCYAILDYEELPYYEDYVKKARKMGIPVEFWDEERVTRELGAQIYAGAVFDPNGGQVHAMKLVRALKQAAEDAGARIYEHSPVTAIQEGEIIRLQVGEANSTVSAGAIVLATNAYTSKLGYFKRQVMPLHAQCAVTPPLTARQLAGMGWQSRLPFYDSRYFLYHLVLTDDNRIVMGGGSAEYMFGNDLHYRGDLARIADLMRNELVGMYPALQGIRFEHVWDGVLGVTYDEIEAAGVMGEHENIYYGLAYNGHGVNSSFMFGSVIAHLYHGEEHGWEYTAYYDYPLKRVPPEPYQWLGVQGMMGYYQWLDAKG